LNTTDSLSVFTLSSSSFGTSSTPVKSSVPFIPISFSIPYLLRHIPDYTEYGIIDMDFTGIVDVDSYFSHYSPSFSSLFSHSDPLKISFCYSCPVFLSDPNNSLKTCTVLKEIHKRIYSLREAERFILKKNEIDTVAKINNENKQFCNYHYSLMIENMVNGDLFNNINDGIANSRNGEKKGKEASLEKDFIDDDFPLPPIHLVVGDELTDFSPSHSSTAVIVDQTSSSPHILAVPSNISSTLSSNSPSIPVTSQISSDCLGNDSLLEDLQKNSFLNKTCDVSKKNKKNKRNSSNKDKEYVNNGNNIMIYNNNKKFGNTSINNNKTKSYYKHQKPIFITHQLEFSLKK
jgi:hypothetical protein